MTECRVFDRIYKIDSDGTVNGGKTDRSEQYVFAPQFIRTLTMCVHISPTCNLACKYCFKIGGEVLAFSQIKQFIDNVVSIYPHADRYIVDMSGAGEPLLQKELIFGIAEYCKTLSDRYLREYLPTFVTNGTLLDAETVRRLQDAGILFGVSIDGTKRAHDRNRVFPDGKGSYDIVVKNIKNIEHNDFVGAAVTFTDGRILPLFLNALSLLPTVAMKPVRSADGEINADDICAGYDELVKFILNKTLGGDLKYLFAIINGDDYFGKFLRRTALNISVYGRCDAGIGRFALANDGKIYCCPAAVGMSEGVMGDSENGIRQSRIQSMWLKQKNAVCEKCFARPSCGGECKIAAYNRGGTFDCIDSAMCKIKRRLRLLSMYFCDELKEKSPHIYDMFIDKAHTVENYYAPDCKLIRAAEKSRGKYTFTALKRIKDKTPSEFEKIYNEICKI